MSSRVRAALTLLSVLTLAGCATSAPAAPAPKATAPSSSAYPVTIDNCGTAVTFTSAPERVITIKSSTLELMLALGVGDTVVASAYSDGPVPASYADIAAAIPVLSDKVPSEEVTLEQEPDLIFAGWESNFSAEGVGERATLDRLGVASYVAPAACQGPGYAPDPLTFDAIFATFTEAGKIFDASAEAARLISDEQDKLAAIEPDDRELTAAWYSSGRDKPFVGGGTGAPELIMSSAGLRNVFSDVPESWTSASWEAVAAADPDVLVLVDSAWNSAASKIALLEANPVTAHLTAVKNRAYVIVPFPATEAGVRTVDAVGTVVDQLP